MISVIIPLYNKEATIKRSIQSVINQTYQNFELIVVDDGSTDKSAALVKSIKNDRIRLVSQPNLGVSAARNRGVQEAKYGYVTFLDADDEWMPDFLETVIRLDESFPNFAICSTAYKRIDAHGRPHSIELNGIPDENTFQLNNYFEVAAQSDPPIHSSSIMVRKEAIQAIGGFPENIHQGEDLLTWARLAANYSIAYCREPHSIFYTGETTSMDRPKRVPASDDKVGQGLEELYRQNPNINGLQQYISHWHKMRASMYLRLPHCADSCREEIKKANYWHSNKKLNLYQLFLLFPYQIRMQLLKRI